MRKLLSPYQNKTLRRTKVQNVKCKLSVYQTRDCDPKTGQQQPRKIFYYEVSDSDGSYKKLLNEQDAIAAFEQLIEFEKRQTCIRI